MHHRGGGGGGDTIFESMLHRTPHLMYTDLSVRLYIPLSVELSVRLCTPYIEMWSSLLDYVYHIQRCGALCQTVYTIYGVVIQFDHTTDL